MIAEVVRITPETPAHLLRKGDPDAWARAEVVARVESEDGYSFHLPELPLGDYMMRVL